MSEFKTNVGGVDVWVSFVCRYRDVNTYGLRIRGQIGIDRVDVTDAGTFYHPNWIGPIARGDALECVRRFEAAARVHFEKWAAEQGVNPSDYPKHALLA